MVESSAYRSTVIPQQAPERPIATLNALQSAAGVAAFVIAVVAVIFGGDGSVPGWLGLIVTVLAGIIAAFSVRWYRNRPIEIGDWKTYQQTTIVRFAIAIDPAVIGAVLTFVGDSPWPAVVGGILSIVGLALAPVSNDDYIRHQIIYIDENVEVPAEKWGTADPDAVPPWDILEEGHGHGMQH